mmetsp:Transcript_32431/g.90802  ORF Transcript_32431/g.90802 Transcript_32431/m.90802 type:complete len:85 (-) Transcript_32431:226-480(-)
MAATYYYRDLQPPSRFWVEAKADSDKVEFAGVSPGGAWLEDMNAAEEAAHGGFHRGLVPPVGAFRDEVSPRAQRGYRDLECGLG